MIGKAGPILPITGVLTMHRIMEELHRDHINIDRLLKLLESELKKVSEDGDPDLDLMIDIVDYVENYPDLYHHPREDIVFKAFKARSLEATEIIDRLMEEHRLLPKMTHDFRLLLEEVQNGSIIISRDELLSKAQEYVDIQRSHLGTEEALIYPMINENMDSEDWTSLDASMPGSKDPLFDAEMDRYRNILSSLKQRESEES